MTDEEKLQFVTDKFNSNHPETIFKYNITLKELSRFWEGIKSFYLLAQSDEGLSIYTKSEDRLFHLGILMHIRDKIIESQKYFKQIKNKDILGMLSEDF